MHAYICFYRGFVLVHGGLGWGFCLEGFVRGGFCPSFLLSEYICYNIKLNITFNFRFYMYEKMLLDPLPSCHKLSHLLGPTPLPLEHDILYGRPLKVLVHGL